ncbi:Oxidoreductase HTATIP2 [Mycena sanguinolenta]|uniref:Oxidoreductase HTATIP2 n=1 Tax=Mycena sanguinolenta TaxID=230812 RepID=A0A8H6Z626_9AGAR|nr:Oxidoreductase HTATIP2 [Mycena sanguinolenta]
MSAGKTCLILGATGQVGSTLMKELVASNVFTKIGEFGRKNTPLDKLPPGGKDKVEQHVIDFEKLEAAGMKEGKWDVIFIAMGTNRKAAGSQEAFEKIDREYVINAAKAARVEGHNQRLVYVSTFNADVNASLPYFKSKGITEVGLANVGYDDTIVFRPGFLGGTNRDHFRLGESIAVGLTRTFFSTGYHIMLPTLAKGLRIAGEVGTAGLPVKTTQEGKEGAKFTLVLNPAALQLGK